MFRIRIDLGLESITTAERERMTAALATLIDAAKADRLDMPLSQDEMAVIGEVDDTYARPTKLLR